MSRGVLLPSNDYKGLDFDLLLVQQSRKFYHQIKELENKSNIFYKTKWSKLSNKEKNYFSRLRKYERRRWQKKLEWLVNKQSERRRLPVCNVQYDPKYQQKERNKKSRHRYKKRKELKIAQKLEDTKQLNILDIMFDFCLKFR